MTTKSLESDFSMTKVVDEEPANHTSAMRRICGELGSPMHVTTHLSTSLKIPH